MVCRSIAARNKMAHRGYAQHILRSHQAGIGGAADYTVSDAMLRSPSCCLGFLAKDLGATSGH